MPGAAPLFRRARVDSTAVVRAARLAASSLPDDHEGGRHPGQDDASRPGADERHRAGPRGDEPGARGASRPRAAPTRSARNGRRGPGRPARRSRTPASRRARARAATAPATARRAWRPAGTLDSTPTPSQVNQAAPAADRSAVTQKPGADCTPVAGRRPRRTGERRPKAEEDQDGRPPDVGACTGDSGDDRGQDTAPTAPRSRRAPAPGRSAPPPRLACSTARDGAGGCRGPSGDRRSGRRTVAPPSHRGTTTAARPAPTPSTLPPPASGSTTPASNSPIVRPLSRTGSRHHSHASETPGSAATARSPSSRRRSGICARSPIQAIGVPRSSTRSSASTARSPSAAPRRSSAKGASGAASLPPASRAARSSGRSASVSRRALHAGTSSLAVGRRALAARPATAVERDRQRPPARARRPRAAVPSRGHASRGRPPRAAPATSATLPAGPATGPAATPRATAGDGRRKLRPARAGGGTRWRSRTVGRTVEHRDADPVACRAVDRLLVAGVGVTDDAGAGVGRQHPSRRRAASACRPRRPPCPAWSE